MVIIQRGLPVCSCLELEFESHFTYLRFWILLQIKALLKERLSGKATGGSSGKSKSDSNESIELNSRNFDELVLKSKDLWIVEFFAPW